MAVVMVLALASCSTLQGKDDVRIVSVSGTGTVSVEPDMASFYVNVSETKKTTSEAQQAANQKIAQVMDVLKGAGIEEKDIKTTSLNISPEYTWNNNVRNLVGQRCSQTLSVKVMKLDSLGGIIDQLGNVDGIQFDSISFDKEDKSEAYKEARKAAAKDAESKASVYAESFGMVLGKPVTVSEGSVSAVPLRKTMMAMAAAVPEANSYSTSMPDGQMQISTTVSVAYEVK
jgi:uncharacterized protein YggE